MNSAKSEAKKLIESMPDNCTFEDIQYHLYVIEKVQKGIYRSQSEGDISHQRVKEKYSEWLQK